MKLVVLFNASSRGSNVIPLDFSWSSIGILMESYWSSIGVHFCYDEFYWNSIGFLLNFCWISLLAGWLAGWLAWWLNGDSL